MSSVCLSKKKISMLVIFKLRLPLKNKSIDLKNLQQANWDEMTKKQKLYMNKFKRDVKDNDL